MIAIELLQLAEGIVDDALEGRVSLEHTEAQREWLEKWRSLTAQGEHYDKEAILVRLVKMEIEYRMSDEDVRTSIAILGPLATDAVRKLITATVVGELLNQLSIRLSAEEYTIMVSTETLMQRNAELRRENTELRERLQEIEFAQAGE